MKNYLIKKQKRLEDKKAELMKRAKETNDVGELRAIQDEILDISNELHDIADELANVAKTGDDDGEDRACVDDDKRSVPASAMLVNNIPGVVVGSYNIGEQRANGNVLESLEYREAFRQLWTRGTPIPKSLMGQVREYVNSLPEEQRAGTPISTSDTAAVIPLTIMREVINTVRTPYGNIYDAVRKTSVAGAVEYPIGEFEADFHWVTEGTVSPEQDIGAVATVSFGYFEAELRIAQTFLSALLSIDAFEAEISKVIARAYRKFMDNAIVNGDGKGKITGIAAGTTKAVTMTAAQMSDWTQWEKRFFAGLTPGYEDGTFIFARSTAVKYLKTMADGNNRPLFYEATGGRIGDGDSAYDDGFFFGRRMKLTVPSIVTDFDTASQNDVIGYFFQPDYYVLNENWGFTVDRYYSYERRKWITVATVVVDGKPLNSTGFVKILKG